MIPRLLKKRTNQSHWHHTRSCPIDKSAKQRWLRFLELKPFSIIEVQATDSMGFNPEKLWFRGGFPDCYLASRDFVVYSGTERFPMAEDTEAVGIVEFLELAKE